MALPFIRYLHGIEEQGQLFICPMEKRAGFPKKKNGAMSDSNMEKSISHMKENGEPKAIFRSTI